MPKRKGGRGAARKGQKRPPRGQTRTPVVEGAWGRGGEGESGSESDGELGQEQLEGLALEDMQMISKMGL